MAVGCCIQWRNVSAFNAGAVTEEEDDEQSLAKTTSFSNSKGCFKCGPWNSCNVAIKPLVKM
jgi:hypothetical protein